MLSHFMLCRLYLLTSVAVVICGHLGAANYHVNAAQPDDSGDGLSWPTAKKSIQAAVDIAASGDVVWVTDGVYDTNHALSPGDGISNRVCVGTPITVRSVNGHGVTVIDGLRSIRGLYLANRSKLIGFTIRQGRNPGHFISGGGAHIRGGSTLIDCVLTSNAASYGAGAYVCEGSTVSNCVFRNGNATYGGGAYLCQGSTASNCLFANSSAGYGGGAYVVSGRIVDGVLVSNNASYGGGVYIETGEVIRTIVECNQAQSDGGGVFARLSVIRTTALNCNSAGQKGGGVYLEDGQVDNSVLSSNSAYAGGGLWLRYSAASDCKFFGNLADQGGGAFLFVAASITNSLIASGNRANEGGGLYLMNGPTIHSCTIAGNFANSRGGGIFATDGGWVNNSIVYNNSALYGGNNWQGGQQMYFSYCCTTPTVGLTSSNGCIVDSPQLIALGSDYHLNSDSPCIDSGFALPWMTSARDLDANPRILGSTVDIGCYEFVPEPSVVWWYLLVIASSMKGRDRHFSSGGVTV